MDPQLEGAVSRFIGKEEGDLPDAAADNDDVEDTPRDIEHEQIYYLLADAYPDKFEDAQDAKETIHEVLGVEDTEKAGETFYSEINDEEVTVEAVEGDKVRVSSEDGHEWWEREEDVRDKITDGAWDEEKDEDPCWEGYEQQGMKEGDDGEPVPNCVPKNDSDEKGIDEEEATEDDDDFNPGNTPDNLDQHPYDEAEWQEDYEAEYGDDEAEEKACGHTDHRGRPLEQDECPWCEGGDEA